MAHTSVTLGGQIPGQPGLIHRRLDAGEARRGSEVRDSSSGDQMAGEGHLRDADELAHRVVVARGVGMGGGEHYELTGGEVLRASDNNDDMGRFWANRRAGRGLCGVGNATGLSP